MSNPFILNETYMVYEGDVISTFMHLRLFEGLIESYDYKVAYRLIKKHLDNVSNKEYSLNIHENNGIMTISLEIDGLLSEHEYELIMQYIKVCGWYIGYKNETPTKSYYRFEPSHQTSVNDRIYGHAKYLYHLTPSSNESRILKKGLIPKGFNGGFDMYTPIKGYNHPERIYCLEFFDPGETGLLKASMVMKGVPNEPFALFQIDVSKLNKDVNIFYKDPMYNFGVYTTSPIFPHVLTLYTHI